MFGSENVLFRVNHLFSHPSVNRDVFTVDKVISFFTKESTHAGYLPVYRLFLKGVAHGPPDGDDRSHGFVSSPAQ